MGDGRFYLHAAEDGLTLCMNFIVGNNTKNFGFAIRNDDEAIIFNKTILVDSTDSCKLRTSEEVLKTIENLD